MRKIAIYGATSAIATEVARIYAQRSSELVLIGRSQEKLDILKGDLLARGAIRAECIASDLNDFGRHEEILVRADQALGTLDLVLIAHGTLSNQERCQQDFAAAEQELRTNFLSVVSLLTIVANLFEQRRRGTIAVISSVAGDRGRQSNYIYGTAKGAVSIFLQGLRNRLARSNVHVVTIKPGFVDTPMTAHLKKGGLWAAPDVVARAIVAAIDKRRNVVYVPGFWLLIMLVIRNIPEFIFKRMKL